VYTDLLIMSFNWCTGVLYRCIRDGPKK